MTYFLVIFLLLHLLQMRGLIYFCVLLLCSTQLSADKKIKYVTTLIDAKWNETPLVLEAAEYLSDENPRYFWKFIDAYSQKISNLVIGKLLIQVDLRISFILCFYLFQFTLNSYGKGEL